MTDPDDIYNWRRVNARITSSGRLRRDDVRRLKELGVTWVINLALASHPDALDQEAEKMAAQGIGYTHIPVDFKAPSEEDFAQFCTAMEGAGDATLHIHCIANFRVSAFLYRYDRDVRGASETQARALMDSVWQPGGVWAAFIGDTASIDEPHRSADGRPLD
ncbi:MAG: protein tyrosine phosphatase family protein [Pseudomonadota bacterium]